MAKIVRGGGSSRGPKKLASKTGGKKAAAERLIRKLKDAKKTGDISSGLDALIDSIKKESSKDDDGGSSALSIIPKVSDSEGDLVTEEVDERVLSLIGQDGVVDIDYATYKTLLREKMAAARMANSKIPTEETEILTEEFKRVKRKTGRFKVKKKKISKNSFFDNGSAPKTNLKALPPAVNKREVEQDEKEEKINELEEFVRNILAPSLTKIQGSLQGVLDNLNKQTELEKKEAKAEDKARQKEKRTAREAKLEGGGSESAVKKTAEKISKPAMGIFDFIKNFVMQTLMGGAFAWLLNFLKDPAGNFDKMWKGLVNGIIGLLNNVISFLYDNLIMPINRAINAINTAITDMETQINNALSLFGQGGITLPKIPLIPKAQIQTIPLAGQPPNQGGPITFTAPQMVGGGLIDPNTGQRIRGMGADTQLVALSPGEVVMSNKAGDMYGRDNLLAANAAAGGTNRPRVGKGVLGFRDGGQVGRTVFSAGHYNTGYNSSGIPIGSDGLPVSGTTDPGTGVAEYQATKHLINTLKMLVQERGLSSRIGFENITAERGDKGLRGVPTRVESTPGTQFVDLHFDQHAQGGTPGSAGRSGIITRNLSPVDRALAAAFGDFGRGFKMGKIGVAEAGGTILEVAAIDDPNIKSLLNEVKSGQKGPHSRAMAEKILNATLSGMDNKPVKVSPLSSSNTEVSVPVSPAPNVTVVPVPVGSNPNSQSISNTGANQSKVPGFSAIDANNFEMMVVKSIYNIVG